MSGLWLLWKQNRDEIVVRLTNTFVSDSNKPRGSWPRFETKILSDTKLLLLANVFFQVQQF